jgi:signal peptidase II
MRTVLWVGLAVFVVDQASKYLVVHWLRLAEVLRIDVLPPYFNLRMAWNRGINFGLLDGTGPWLLIAVALLISAWVIWWVRRGGHRPGAYVAAGLLLGGAIGNVVDRVLYGAVADFINMSCCGISNPFSFNVADISIFLGAVGLVFLIDDKDKPGAGRADKTP